MANYNSLSALFTAIADNIRVKLGIDDDIVATDFPEKIAEITSGAPVVTRYLTVARTDVNAPASATLKISYPYIDESDNTWTYKVVSIPNGGSVQVPIPEPVYMTTSTSYRNREVPFEIVLYRGAAEYSYGFYIYNSEPETTAGLVFDRWNTDAYSSSERIAGVRIDTAVVNPTALLTIQLQGYPG